MLLLRCLDVERSSEYYATSERVPVNWADFSNQHGDCGRELVMYLARKRSGLTLRGIGDALGGVEYKNVSKAVRRFEDSLANHSNRRSIARSLLSQLANGET